MLDFPKGISYIANVLKNPYKKNVWLVGGSVRDIFLGREPKDYDLATDALPEEVESWFPKTIPTGIEHGTVTVMIDGQGFEVTTLRADGNYSDGRRPDNVKYTDSIEEDLSRRDFTCNAIAINLFTKEVIDPFDGQIDIGNKILKAVRDPAERFLEDGLRVLRAVRFSSILDFEIESNTRRQMDTNQTIDTFKKVSIERVRDEWMKILAGSDKPSDAFLLMRCCGILYPICPQLVQLLGVEQNEYHEFDVWDHTMKCMDKIPKEKPLIRLAALFHDIAKPQTKAWNERKNNWSFIGHEREGKQVCAEIMRGMKFPNEEIEYVSHLVRRHLIMYTSRWSKATIRRWIKKVGVDNIDDVLLLAEADGSSKGKAKKSLEFGGELEKLRERVIKVLEEKPPLDVNKLAINGKDIMNVLDIEPGPAIGLIKNALMELVLEDPEKNDKEFLLAEIKKIHNKETQHETQS